MNGDHDKVGKIFDAAAEFVSPAERAAYLDAVCGQDRQLRAEIEELLAHDAAAGSFLNRADGSQLGATAEEQSIRERPGTVIGSYKLLEQIGEGGFGVVFMAEQQQPIRRKVALKVIKPGMDTRQVIARFEAERQALALMDHPNIARVLDAGETASGRPYFVMDLIKGIPITEYCDKNQLSPKERLELFIPVCQAVQHAHQKGIIHRDIKPTNVLVTMHDGTPVVKIIDFGIAKATGQQLTDKTLFTNFAQMIGTPLYMSPEQAEMSALDIDTRSDIYSLGVLLYELLTGSTPFHKDRLKTAAYDEIRRLIREEEPPRPSTRMSSLGETSATVSANRKSDPKKLSQLFRGDLDWIVMKGLEKDRRRRYETASGLARDIERYLHDEPVEACPPSAWYRFGKFARRNRAALAITALLSVAALTVAAVATVSSVLLHGERNATLEQLRETEEAEKLERAARVLAQERLFEARLAQARAGRKSGQAGHRVNSLKALGEAGHLAKRLDLGPSAQMDLRNEAIACFGLTDVRLVRQWEGWSPGMVDRVWFDPDLEHYARSDVQGNVYLHRVADGAEVARLTGPEKLGYSVVFSQDGKRLALLANGRAGPQIQVWEWRNQTVRWTCTLADANPGTFTFSPDGQFLAVGRGTETISILSLATGKEVHTLQLGARPHSLSFSPDGGKLAVSSWANTQVQIREVATGTLLNKFAVPAVPYAALAWHPEGRLLAASGNDFNVYLWNVETGQEHAVLRGHHALPHEVQFSSRGDVLSTWAGDGTVRLWNPWSGKEICRVMGGNGHLSRDGKRLACRHGKQLLLWEVVGGEEYRTLANWEETPASQVISEFPVLSPDGRWLAVSQHHGMRIFDMATGRQAAFLNLGRTSNAAFHPSGTALFTSTAAGLCRWPFVVDQEVLRIGPPENMFSVFGNLSLDSKGRFLALANSSWGAGVLDLHKPGTKTRMLSHPFAQHAAISPDGKWIVTGTHHGRGVKVWEAETGKFVRDLTTDLSNAFVAFSPDGRQLFTTTNAGAFLWETDSWKEQRRLTVSGVGTKIAWSGDGRLFALIRSPYHVELQDAVTGNTLATVETPDDLRVFQMAFTPAGDKLVMLSWQPGHVRVWDLRLVRKRLAGMGLDWDAPAFPPARPEIEAPARALRVDVQLVNALEQAARQKQAEGDTHRARKEYAEAIACYREVLRSEPNNSLILNRVAWLLAIGPAAVRDSKDALAFSRKAVELAPDARYGLNTLGAAHYRAGHFAEALRLLQQAEKQAEGNKAFAWPLNWLVQALCHAQLGERDLALAAYEKSLRWLKETGATSAAIRHETQLLRDEVEALLNEMK